MKKRSDKAVAKLWNQFIDILRDQGVKGESAHWYVMRAEHYLAAFPGQRLVGHPASGLMRALSGTKQKKLAEFLAVSISAGCYTD